VKDHLEQAEEVFVSSIVLGELYFGITRDMHFAEIDNLKVEIW
jgi:predicted nucleic acid-binding protein